MTHPLVLCRRVPALRCSARLVQQSWVINIRTKVSSTSGGRTPKNELSRKERRARERQKRGKGEPRGAESSSAPLGKLPISRITRFKNRMRRLYPVVRLPGGSYFQRHHVIPVFKRLSLWLVLVVLATHDEISPFVIDELCGPSMLPTMFPIGDFYLRETGAWRRLLGWKCNYQVGDVVVWKHPEDNVLTCKRIVGVENQTVLRYGEFVDLYKDRPDWGICWPTSGQTVGGRNIYSSKWEAPTGDGEEPVDVENDRNRTFVVPKGHVWLEGDFPLCSMDSRHYGPVPIDAVRGRVVFRLWPLWRDRGVVSPHSLMVGRQRPTPLSPEQLSEDGRYNLHKRPRV